MTDGPYREPAADSAAHTVHPFGHGRWRCPRCGGFLLFGPSGIVTVDDKLLVMRHRYGCEGEWRTRTWAAERQLIEDERCRAPVVERPHGVPWPLRAAVLFWATEFVWADLFADEFIVRMMLAFCAVILLAAWNGMRSE